jgi:hypothetical protein
MSISSERVKAWRHRTKTKMVEAMGGKCQCCGYDKCKEALAFHHIDPTQKDIGFGDLRANPKKWNDIVKELKKCVLVCHNCHSEIHAGMREIPTAYTEFNEEFAEWHKVAEYDSCPVCNEEKLAKQKYCSHKCANTNRRKVDWDSIDLLKLLQEHTISELEKMFGVSNAAIYKRRDKILQQQSTHR